VFAGDGELVDGESLAFVGNGALVGASLALVDVRVAANISLTALPLNSGNNFAENLSFGGGCDCWRFPLINSSAGLAISMISISSPSTVIFVFMTPYTGQ
jgi:hypothetical protein